MPTGANSSDSDETTGGLGKWAVPGFFALLLGVAFHQVFSLGLIVGWDDSIYFLNRSLVENWTAASWYDRLFTPDVGYSTALPTFLYFLVQQLPAALVVPAAHALNLLFHAGSTFLAWRLTKRWFPEGRLALGVTAIWCVHPLTVEAVAWITNLKTAAFAFFVLLTIALWERQRRAPTTAAAVGLVLTFVAALACRPEAVALPFLLAAFAFVSKDLRRSLTTSRLVAPLVSMVAVGAAYLPIAIENHRATVEGISGFAATSIEMSERIFRIGKALSLQAWHVVWPFDLHPHYYPDALGEWTAWAGLVLFTAFVGATAWFTWTRRAAARPLLLALAFYLPASGVAFLPRFTADTYMYLPLLGIITAVAVGLRRLLSGQLERPRLVIGLVVAVALSLAIFSAGQTLRWQNTMTLWGPVAEAHPDRPRPRWILATALMDVGEAEAAAEQFEAVYPALLRAGHVPVTMTRALLEAGRADRAIEVLWDVLSSDRVRSRGAGCLLLTTMTRHDVGKLDRDFAARAVEHCLSGRLLELGESPADVASRLVERHPSAARTFIAGAANLLPADCETWRKAEELGAVDDTRRDAIPADCE